LILLCFIFENIWNIGVVLYPVVQDNTTLKFSCC
jgi:hypothetical protein